MNNNNELNEIKNLAFECTKYCGHHLFSSVKASQRSNEQAFTEVFKLLLNLDAQIKELQRDVKIIRCDVNAYMNLNSKNYLLNGDK